MLTDRGASAMLSPADLGEGWLDDATHLHVSGYVLLHGASRAAGLAAMAEARRRGISVSVDPSSTAPIRAVGSATTLHLLDAADMLLPNLAEARLLTGHATAREAARALGGRVSEVVVTDGARGAVWSDGAEVCTVDAAELPAATGNGHGPAGEEIDPVGAGDVFTAGWLGHRVADHAEPLEALRAAARLAALAVSRTT